MATIYVDGKKFEVSGADNLLAACLSLGLDIPYFCWHPCRQCAVKQYADENDKRGKIVMSCMIPAADKTYISIDDEEAKHFRESVVEWLMANHPHDCPVCEEGGHCHLQDMTVMVGHNKRKYRFNKRTHINQDLGPFIGHEMNRCIACYRCVRFYCDYAGGKDLGVYGAHDNVYFGRVADGALESEFSGNLTEVCPTGVFTDKTHSAHYARKWDMQFAPSVCHGCSSGCNISPGERYGKIRRIENRFNGAVNQYFICDRGRFGYEYVNDDNRPKNPLLRGSKISINDAVDLAAANLKGLKLVGIGSARSSLENNHALCKLVGRDNFATGFSRNEQDIMQSVVHLLRSSPAAIVSIRETENHDVIFILGEDLTQTAARLALSVRVATQKKAQDMASNLGIDPWLDAAARNISQDEFNPLYIASVGATKLDDCAQKCFHGSPDDLVQLGFAIAHAIDNHAPKPHNLTHEMRSIASEIATKLIQAKRPLFITGTSLGSTELIDASSNIIKALYAKNQRLGISLVVQEANSLGVAIYGGHAVEDVLSKIDDNSALIVLESDLYRKFDQQMLDDVFARAKFTIVLDHQHTSTTAKARLLLPAASFAEGDGTLVSQEARAQRSFQVYDPSYYDENTSIRDSWRWLHALNAALNEAELSWQSLDDVTADCAASNPDLGLIVQAAPAADFRIKGLKIAREPIRYSGRTAMRAVVNVHEPRQPQDGDSALSFSMEGYSGTAENRNQIPFAWSPGWNSPQSWNKFQDEVGMHLKAGDPGVRLIEAEQDKLSWFVPSVESKTLGLQIVPIHHLFGSEENSAKSAAIKQRIPKLYATLNSMEAAKLGLITGDNLEITVSSVVLNLPIIINDNLADGVLGIPFGFASISNHIFEQKEFSVKKAGAK